MATPKLIFLCGKMAAGKSTLSKQLAEREGAALIVQDDLLAALFYGEIVDVPAFSDRLARLRVVLTPLVRTFLAKGVSVVMDFAGNTREQRAWFRQLADGIDAALELHYVDASDALCKRQLAERSKDLPPGTPWTSAAEFDLITAYFQPPAPDEAFTIVRYARG
jgi:predicted kinase